MLIPFRLHVRARKLHSIHKFIRNAHSKSDLSASPRSLCPLQHRKLLRISGKDAPAFLQGLVTNDMRHFEDGAKSMYTMFLNNKGRVLYDTLMYKWHDASILVECDDLVLDRLQKHLKIYKLKRQVKIDNVNDELQVWVLVSPANEVDDLIRKADVNISIFKDPRLADLGYRVITTSLLGSELAKNLGINCPLETDDFKYKCLRYRLGVSEGANDLLPGTAFPLEVNCDYLHGVSFHKGCYIGQELTARVHHTGVVRKRIMPLQFSENVQSVDNETVITSDNPKSKNLGKLKGFVLDYGLGLMRIKESLEAKELKVGKYTAKVLKPSWWPMEAPKDKIILKPD